MHYVGKKVVATGYSLGDSVVVLKGSEMSHTETNSCKQATKTMRQKLIDEGAVVDHVFVKSVHFNSPSTAAACVYGGSQNGKIMWANEVYRRT